MVKRVSSGGGRGGIIIVVVIIVIYFLFKGKPWVLVFICFRIFCY